MANTHNHVSFIALTPSLASGNAVFPTGGTMRKLLQTGWYSQERENNGQFTLAQNYPNPCRETTTVPFNLFYPADVQLDIFDPLGRKLACITRKGMSAGEQKISLNLHGLGLTADYYAYQLQVTNCYGVYRLRQMLTVD